MNQGFSEKALTIELQVFFSSQDPVPRLISLHRNQRELCNTQPLGKDREITCFDPNVIFFLISEPISGLVTFRLKYIFRPSNDQLPLFMLPQPIESSNNRNTYATEEPTQQVDQLRDDNSVCGIAVAGLAQSLVVGGKPASRGEW